MNPSHRPARRVLPPAVKSEEGGGELGRDAWGHDAACVQGPGLVLASDLVFVALAEELEYVGRNDGA